VKEKWYYEKSEHWFSSPSLFVCFRFRTIRLLVWRRKEKGKKWYACMFYYTHE